MRRVASLAVLSALVLLAGCSPFATPTKREVEPAKPAINQGYLDSHRRMAAALKRFVVENPVVRESLGDASRLSGDDINLSGTVPVTRVIRFVQADRVVYGIWVTYNHGSATALLPPGDAPLNYPQNYYARMSAIYGAKSVSSKDKAAFLRQFLVDWGKGDYDNRVLRIAQAGSATEVEVRDVFELTPAEGAPIEAVDWIYDPVKDRVLSITLGDEMYY